MSYLGESSFLLIKNHMYNNNSSQPNISYEQLMSMIKQMPKNQLDIIVKRAKSLGISESYIQEGLQIINQIKNN